VSALGLLLAAFVCLRGGSARRAGRTLEVALGDGAVPLPRWCCHVPFAAITLGQVIVGLRHDLLGTLRAHEREHVRQVERWGALFLVAYPLASVLAWIQGGRPYRDNCFERAAYCASDPRGAHRAVASRVVASRVLAPRASGLAVGVT
jgi:hypothetical protein